MDRTLNNIYSNGMWQLKGKQFSLIHYMGLFNSTSKIITNHHSLLSLFEKTPYLLRYFGGISGKNIAKNSKGSIDSTRNTYQPIIQLSKLNKCFFLTTLQGENTEKLKQSLVNKRQIDHHIQ